MGAAAKSGVRAKPQLESEVLRDIRKALCREGILCLRHHVDNRQSRTGLGLGVADLICVVPPHGVLCAIEVKRPGSRSRVSAHQRMWATVVRLHGGIYGVATSVDEARALIALARRVAA